MAQLRGRDQARYVARMFARISRRYDLLNTVMTAGRHYAWRRAAADLAVGGTPGPALDVATGTGDFALELARRTTVSTVVGLDFTPEMLSIAQAKARSKRLNGRLHLVIGDAHTLPFPDGHFMCATVAFGFRNFVDAPQTLREMARVVQPGGRVVILEIVRTADRPVDRLFRLYFRYVTPWLGALLAGDKEAYTYLPQSVQEFASAREVASMLEQAGLHDVSFKLLALGSVAIHMGQKD